MPVWDDVIPADDLAEMGREWGTRQGMGASPALLVVDMTYAFVDDRFPLGHGATGWPCAEAIASLIAAAREHGLPVIYTGGQPSRNAAERGLWKSSGRRAAADLPDPHEIVPPLVPEPHETVIRKRRPSAFFGTELASLLSFLRVDTVVLTGMVTSGCIRATAVDAFSHNLRVTVPEECVADRVRVSHAVSLFDIHMKYGDVLPAREVRAALDGTREASPTLSAT
ncbi:MAG: isochorismatase family protein [Solirubrobacterales bacterium]|nr:isochorismatase family protein [Solirubrobacterales bacterium]